MNYSVFISHCLEDPVVVCQLQKALISKGFKAKADTRLIRSGDPLSDENKQAMEAAAVFLLLVSKGANSSEWVQRETQFALKIKAERDQGYCIIPILLDEAELGALKWIIPDDTHCINCATTNQGIEAALPDLMATLEEALHPIDPGEALT